MPGGGLKLGEDFVEGIKREFLEETGYEVLVNEKPLHAETKLIKQNQKTYKWTSVHIIGQVFI